MTCESCRFITSGQSLFYRIFNRSGSMLENVSEDGVSILNLISLLGLFVMLGFAWLMSSHKTRVNWKLVAMGLEDTLRGMVEDERESNKNTMSKFKLVVAEHENTLEKRCDGCWRKWTTCRC